MNIITVYVEGGLVQDVTGLPEGWDYEVDDRDICSHCGGLDENCKYCNDTLCYECGREIENSKGQVDVSTSGLCKDCEEERNILGAMAAMEGVE